MRTMNAIVGSVALLIASNVVVKAQQLPLIAGPVPVDPGVGMGTVICSGTNVDLVPKDVVLDIESADDVQIDFVDCGVLDPTKSCSTAVTFSASTPAPPSPFVCNISSFSSGGAALRGSICGTVSNPTTGLPNATYCLQALLDNNKSGGWTPSGGP